MAWISLIFAGVFEMFGVTMINKLHKDRNWQSLVLLIFGFGASFLFLTYAMQTLTDGYSLCDLDRNWCIGWGDIRYDLTTENQKTGRELFLSPWY